MPKRTKLKLRKPGPTKICRCFLLWFIVANLAIFCLSTLVAVWSEHDSGQTFDKNFYLRQENNYRAYAIADLISRPRAQSCPAGWSPLLQNVSTPGTHAFCVCAQARKAYALDHFETYSESLLEVKSAGSGGDAAAASGPVEECGRGCSRVPASFPIMLPFVHSRVICAKVFPMVYDDFELSSDGACSEGKKVCGKDSRDYLCVDEALPCPVNKFEILPKVESAADLERIRSHFGDRNYKIIDFSDSHHIFFSNEFPERPLLTQDVRLSSGAPCMDPSQHSLFATELGSLSGFWMGWNVSSCHKRSFSGFESDTRYEQLFSTDKASLLRENGFFDYLMSRAEQLEANGQSADSAANLQWGRDLMEANTTGQVGIYGRGFVNLRTHCREKGRSLGTYHELHLDANFNYQTIKKQILGVNAIACASLILGLCLLVWVFCCRHKKKRVFSQNQRLIFGTLLFVLSTSSVVLLIVDFFYLFPRFRRLDWLCGKDCGDELTNETFCFGRHVLFVFLVFFLVVAILHVLGVFVYVYWLCTVRMGRSAKSRGRWTSTTSMLMRSELKFDDELEAGRKGSRRMIKSTAHMDDLSLIMVDASQAELEKEGVQPPTPQRGAKGPKSGQNKTRDEEQKQREFEQKIVDYYIERTTPFAPKKGIFKKKRLSEDRRRALIRLKQDLLKTPAQDAKADQKPEQPKKSPIERVAKAHAHMDGFDIPVIREVSEEKYEEEEVRERRVLISQSPLRVRIPSSTKRAFRKRSERKEVCEMEDIENCQGQVNVQYKVNQNIMPKPPKSGRKRRSTNLRREAETFVKSQNVKKKRQVRIDTRRDQNPKTKVDADDFENEPLDNNYLESRQDTPEFGARSERHNAARIRIDDMELINSRAGYIRNDTIAPNPKGPQWGREIQISQDHLEGPGQALTGYIRQQTIARPEMRENELTSRRVKADELEGPGSVESGYIRQQTSLKPQKTRKFDVSNPESGFLQQKSDNRLYFEKVSSKRGHRLQKSKHAHVKMTSIRTPKESVIASQDDFSHKVSHGNYLGESEPEGADRGGLEMNFDTSKNIQSMLISRTTFENERKFGRSHNTAKTGAFAKQELKAPIGSFKGALPLESKIILTDFTPSQLSGASRQRGELRSVSQRGRTGGKSVVTIDDIEVIQTVGTTKYIDTSLDEDKHHARGKESQEVYNAFESVRSRIRDEQRQRRSVRVGQGRNGENASYNQSLVRVSGHSSRFNQTSLPRAKSKPSTRTQLSPFKGKKIRKKRGGIEFGNYEQRKESAKNVPEKH